MKKRQIHWGLALPGIMAFAFMLLALIFKVSRATRGESASTALVVAVLPVAIGLGIAIIPVILLISLGDKRYRNAMAQLQSQYPHVFYTVDFRYGPRLLAADKQTVSIWRARMRRLEQEVSWPRGSVPITQGTVLISRAVTVPGIIFTDPNNKLRRMAVSDKVSARIEPLEYGNFLASIT